MHIIFLKFGPNRAQAGEWMAPHLQWLQQGIDEGAFLMAGTWNPAQGGVVLATGTETAAVQRRIEQDPFVIHGVVVAEIHSITPSLVRPDLAPLLKGGQPTAVTS